MLRRIAKRIAREKPDLPLFTIHDSMVTLAEHKDYLWRVIKEKFRAVVGLMPSLYAEEWTQPE